MFNRKRAYTIVVSRKGECLVDEVNYILEDLRGYSMIGKSINICGGTTCVIFVIETRLSRSRFSKIMRRRLGDIYHIDTSRKNLMLIRRIKSKTELY